MTNSDGRGQKQNFSFFQDIKQKIQEEKFSIYEAVDCVVHLKDELLPELHKELLSGKEAYYRLFAAWCLGKINSSLNKEVLEKAYVKESDNNARANIAWAYLKQDNPRLDFCEAMLQDKYFLIKLITLKFIGSHNLNLKKTFFTSYFEEADHPLVATEAIRTIYSFAEENGNKEKILSNVLNTSDNLQKIEAALQSLGNIHAHNSLAMLIAFYGKRKDLINECPQIATQFVKSITSTNESGAYRQLEELYSNSSEKMVKFAVIEALAVGGGPCSLKVLLHLINLENDPDLKNMIESCIEKNEVTTL